MSESITITRIEHDVYEVECGGETRRFECMKNIPELPGCWSLVNQLFYSVRIAHSCLNHE
jgi:hypothetical protein